MKVKDKLATVTDWLIEKELGEVDLEVQTNYESSNQVDLNASPHCVTPEELRKLKQVFGPLKVHKGYNDSNLYLKGEVALPLVGCEDFCVVFYFHNAYECRVLNDNQRTAEKWEELKQYFLDGTLTVRDCKPVDLKTPEKIIEPPPEPDFDAERDETPVDPAPSGETPF